VTTGHAALNEIHCFLARRGRRALQVSLVSSQIRFTCFAFLFDCSICNNLRHYLTLRFAIAIMELVLENMPAPDSAAIQHRGINEMYCQKCGSQMNEDAAFCPKCGSPVNGGAAGPAQNAYSQAPEQNAAPVAKSSKLEKMSLIFSIVGVLFSWAFFFGLPLPIAGLAMGIAARQKSKSGMALASIIMSSAAILVAISMTMLWLLGF
jgi:hypothetical protein